MFPIKIFITKLKHFINGRGVWNQLIFSGGFVIVVWLLWSHYNSSAAFVPKYLRRYLQFPEGYEIPESKLSESELEQLMAKVERLNHNAEVFDPGKHGVVREETTIIAVQVHKDVERLQYLIISLGQVHFIQRVLLVFSHSYYDDNMNELIRSIRFCKYMQIFYPYSLQLHPDKFPGVDPDDCNSTGDRGAAARGDCFDRDARRTEHKQHWWWKLNMIFDGLDLPSNKRVVVFLEEDDYVFPDFLYMLRYARRAQAYFPTAEVIAMGRPDALGLDYDTLIVDSWTPLYDRGLAFNMSAWRKIKEKVSLYCLYDDCSWSYSLMHLFGAFPSGAAEMCACMAPRVVSTRALGAAGAGAGRAGALARARRGGLFPGAVRAAVALGAAGRVRREWAPPRGNGGWADLRDQMLCLDPLVPTTADYTTNTMPAPYLSRNASQP